MSDLKPLGSERLQGDEKIKRILEIARYKEVPKQVVNELSSVEYSKTLSDGVKYVIAKEKLGYIIKKSINEGVEEYIEPMKNRKYYNSYSQALKRLNLLAREVNYVQGVNEGIDLFNEQKRYTLKTPKPAPSETTYDEPTPDMSMDSGIGAEADLGMGSETPTGGELDLGLDMDMGADQPTDMGMDLGSEDTEMKPTDEGDVDFKTVQKITGKLSQKIRSLDKDKGMDSQDIKYVINSIISAIDMKNLDDDDREEIVDKIEGFDDEYGTEGEGELDLSGEDMGDMEPEIEPEMGVGTEEPKEGYQNVMDSIFAESKIDKLLSNYFNIKTEEKPIIEHRTKMNYLGKKIQKIEQKKDLVNFSVTTAQEQKALSLFEGYANTKFIGRTNKQNLVLIVNGKEVKVTPNGRTI